MKNYLYLIVLFATIAWGIGPGRGENKTTDRKISMSELPQPARQLLRTYFPGARVLQCVHSRTWDEYGVKVSGGYDLEFDRKGRWEEIDSHDTPWTPVWSSCFLRRWPNISSSITRVRRSRAWNSARMSTRLRLSVPKPISIFRKRASLSRRETIDG